MEQGRLCFHPPGLHVTSTTVSGLRLDLESNSGDVRGFISGRVHRSLPSGARFSSLGAHTGNKSKGRVEGHMFTRNDTPKQVAPLN